MKKRHPVTFKIKHLNGDHRSGERIETWMIDSKDGYLNAGWVFHEPPTQSGIIHAMHRKIEWNRIEDER